MFVPIWLVFLGSGTVMAVFAIVWGIRSGQFEEQDRARYLPLAGLSARELGERPPLRRGPTFYGILAIFVSGFVVLLATLALVLKST